MALIPVLGATESAEAYLRRLIPQLRGLGDGGAANTARQIVDGSGRVIAGPAGLFAYVGDRLVVAPDIVQIDTADLVDAAIETAKLGDGAVTGAKILDATIGTAKIANAAIVSAKIADAAIVTAKIDDLAVNNAKIANMSVSKLTAGVIGANAIYVGNNRLELDGLNGRLVVRDAAAQTRVELGTLVGGGNGIVIRDATGAVLLASGSTSYLSGTFIDSLSASKISAGTLNAALVNVINLSANSITTGTLVADYIHGGVLDFGAFSVNNLTANKIAAGTLASGVILSSKIDANQINAGTLAAGVVYAGTLAASNITSGTLGAGVVYVGEVNAWQIATTSLAAINSVLGTVTSGTITSGTFQTATSGRRITVTASDNYLRAYDSGGNLIATVGDSGGSGSVTSYTANAAPAVSGQTSGGGAGIYGYSTSSGPALQGYSSGAGYGLITSSYSGYGADCQSATNHAGHFQCSTGGNVYLGTASGWAAYSYHGGYGPFTGAHDGLLSHSVTPEPGDILVDVQIVARSGVSDAIAAVALSSLSNQRRAIGVFVRAAPLTLATIPAAMRDLDMSDVYVIAAAYQGCAINAVGEGQINVCGENGDIQPGDLIVCSSTTGKGMRQNDDIVRSYTVAKAREAAIFDEDHHERQIACIYLCG